MKAKNIIHPEISVDLTLVELHRFADDRSCQVYMMLEISYKLCPMYIKLDLNFFRKVLRTLKTFYLFFFSTGVHTEVRI
jgi:hypothetical protein